MSKLEGKVAVVTGASVVVNYARDAEAARRVVEKIEAEGGHALAVQADVSAARDVGRLFATAREAFGAVNLLVNNAGVYAFMPLEAIAEDEFHRQFDTNVLGPFLTMREFAGQPEADNGSIINVVTAGISNHPPYTALYTATKSALSAATIVAAKELAPRGIRVNAVAPTASDTEGTRAMAFVGSDAGAQTASQIPLGRLGTPDDIAPLIVFLASGEARFITGDVIFASGGHR